MLKVIGLMAGMAMLGQIVIPTSCSSETPVADDIIAGTQLLCQFVPTIQSVQTILKVNTTLSTVTAAVAAICGSVGKPPATVSATPAPDTEVAVYNGVPVVGHWVPKS